MAVETDTKETCFVPAGADEGVLLSWWHFFSLPSSQQSFLLWSVSHPFWFIFPLLLARGACLQSAGRAGCILLSPTVGPLGLVSATQTSRGYPDSQVGDMHTFWMQSSTTALWLFPSIHVNYVLFWGAETAVSLQRGANQTTFTCGAWSPSSCLGSSRCPPKCELFATSNSSQTALTVVRIRWVAEFETEWCSLSSL